MFVQYYFIGDECHIEVDPHGNRKSETKYQRTSETTKQRIQELCVSSSKPKDVFHTLIEEQGGLHKVKSGAHIARDRQQVRNYSRKETHCLDPIVECSDLAKLQEKKGSRFLRDVRCAPEFTMFMSTDRQLQEINKFCTDEKCVSVLGVDTTFNIGHYYITITTYRHMMLLNSFGVEPVMIGPILLHQRKSFDSYFKLSSSMLQDCPSLKHLRVFGTDGDVNLGNAFQVCFTNSAHLLCDIHMVDNIERKLSSLNIKGKTAKEYIHDIFGIGKETVKVKGLVDCSSESEMDGKMDSLKSVWKSRHVNGQAFMEYFVENKLDLIKQCMSTEIRSACGLGFPPKPYTQNANECMNAVLKADIFSGKKESKNIDPYDFVKLAEKSVKRQENEIKLALIGKGEYCLKPEYHHLSVREDDYWKKTEVQREAVFKRMQNEPVATDIQQHTGTSQIPNLMREVSEHVRNIKTVPQRVLNDMFLEASNLVSDPGNTVPLPGIKDGNMYIVANKEKPTEPFKIKYAPSTQTFSCEKKCARFSGFKICQHCVAVAYTQGLLGVSLKKFSKLKAQTCSLSELANTSMPANRGKKNNKATQKRKGRLSNSSRNFLFYDEPATVNNEQSEAGQPLHVTFMAGLIKKCYGCDQLFQSKYRNPPHDVILKRFDYRTYLSPNTKTKKRSPTLQNTYFHLNRECVRRICPTFEMKNVLIHEEIKEQLTNDHKNVMRNAGLNA